MFLRMPGTLSVKEQGHFEAQEMFMITDAVQCESCYNHATLGHSYCKCGHTLPGASDEAKKQVLKKVMNCFIIFTTSAFV